MEVYPGIDAIDIALYIEEFSTLSFVKGKVENMV
jgi:hypothetical protein